MNLVAAIVIGGFVGWLAGQTAGRKGLIASILTGIAGAFFTSIGLGFFTGSEQEYLSFSWFGVFWSFIGALIPVLLLNAIQVRPPTEYNHRLVQPNEEKSKIKL